MAEQVPAEAQKLQSGMQNPGRQLFSGGKRSRLLRCLPGTISRYEKTYALWCTDIPLPPERPIVPAQVPRASRSFLHG